MTAEDIALGYRQLLEVERGWRDMKQVIDLRPVYHRKEERIRAHVILCWLALLLARIAENATGDTWPNCAASSTGSPSAPSPARHLPPAHRDQPSPSRHPRTARHRPATEDLPAHPCRYPLTSGNTPPRYTPSTQETARSSTSNHRFADQHATQLRNPGPAPSGVPVLGSRGRAPAWLRRRRGGGCWVSLLSA